MVRLLLPLVDDGAGPGVDHGAEEGVLVAKVARLGLVAARLGHEDGDGVVRGLILEVRVAGLVVARVATPAWGH